MSEINGGPAFPWQIEFTPGSWNSIKGRAVPEGKTEVEVFPGMTLRDYFAGQALVSQLGYPRDPQDGPLTPSDIAFMAYAMADAMLAARSSNSRFKGEE